MGCWQRIGDSCQQMYLWGHAANGALGQTAVATSRLLSSFAASRADRRWECLFYSVYLSFSPSMPYNKSHLFMFE